MKDERKAYDGYLAYLGQKLGILDSAKAEEKEEGMIEVAKEMLKEGDSDEKISRVIKLPIVTIEEFTKELDM